MFADEWLWLSQASDARRKRRNRLHDISVDEVSLVDRAANKRRFLITKKEDEMGREQTGDEFDDRADDGADLALISADSGDEADSFGVDPADVMGDDVKQETIQTPAKDAVSKAIREGIETLMPVAAALRIAKKASARSERPMPSVFGTALRSVSAKLAAVGQQFPVAAQKADEENGDEDGETDKPKGKAGNCPPGQVWDPESERCVPARTMTDETKETAKRRLDAAQKAIDGLKKSVDDMPAGGGDDLPPEFARKLRIVAMHLGALPVTLSPTAKGFVTVDDDVTEAEVAKAAATLEINPEQRDELVNDIEKCIDELCTLSGEVDMLRERAIDPDDTTPMPNHVAASVAKSSADILEIAEKHAAENDEDGNGAGSDGADDNGSKGEDGDANDGNDDGADADAEIAQKGECESCGNPAHEKSKAKKQKQCPPGQVMDKETGECIPLSQAGKQKPKKKPAGDNGIDEDASDMTKAIAAAVGQAFEQHVDPLVDDVAALKKGLKDQAVLIEKMAAETAGPNGSTAREKVRKQGGDDAASGLGELMDAKELQELRDADLIF